MMWISEKRGFSLIETCIYIALLSFFMVATAAVVWQIIGGVGRVYIQLRTEQEGLFVIQKIEHLLYSGEIVTPQNGTSTLLVVQSNAPGAEVATVRRNTLSGAIEVQREGGGAFVPLTTPAVTVSTLLFQLMPRDTEKPAQLRILFNLDGELFETYYIMEARH